MSNVLLSTLSEVITKDILPKAIPQFNEETYLLSKLPKNKFGGFHNYEKYFTPNYSRNESIASISSTSTSLPTAGRQRYAQGKINPAYTYGVLNIDDRALKATQGKAAAIVNMGEQETMRLVKDMAKDANRQLFGDGSGAVATVSAASTQTTITVTSTKYIMEGQLLTINGDAVQVVSVPSDTTFTVTAAVNVATSEAVVKTEGSAEMNGLFLAADDGTFTTTFENISTATNNWWKAYVNATSTTYTTITQMDSEMRTAMTAVNKYGKVGVILTSFALRDKYTSLNLANQRFNDTIQLDGGFGPAPTYNGVPIVADFDCQDDVMYFLDFDAISLEQLKDMSFETEGRTGIFLPKAGTTLYEAVASYYANLMVINRRQLAKLDNKA